MKGDIIVAAPANYNDAGMVIRVDPGAMFQGGNRVITEANGIMDIINRVVNIWNNLNIGWIGTSATEAQDYLNRWTQAIQNLFGTDANPGSGALPELAAAAEQAAINYAEAEKMNAMMFEGLGFSLASNDPNGPPPRNSNDGPISENAPPPP